MSIIDLKSNIKPPKTISKLKILFFKENKHMGGCFITLNLFDCDFFSNIFIFFYCYRKNSQRKEDGGPIPYDDVYGVNLGEFFEVYVKTLNPNSDNLFQRPQRASKSLRYIQTKIKCLFGNTQKLDQKMSK